MRMPPYVLLHLIGDGAVLNRVGLGAIMYVCDPFDALTALPFKCFGGRMASIAVFLQDDFT